MVLLHKQCHGPVHGAGIYINKSELSGHFSGDGTLSRTCWPINGDTVQFHNLFLSVPSSPSLFYASSLFCAAQRPAVCPVDQAI